MTTSADELGRILSRLHWQCWRADPPPLEVEPAELVAVLPILIRSGSVGLVWPRLRGQLDPSGAIAMALEHAYDTQVAHNETCQCEIARSVTRLREAGIDALLIKGWAVSRLYPAPVVRPAGDIDLVVRHVDYARATDILTGPDALPITVGLDLQDESTWHDRPGEEFWDRAARIEVDDVPVLTPAAEDHLRLLCLHFLRHGGRRPLWLCDVALALESRPGNFEWERFLGTGSVRRGWLMTALGLTQGLVGAVHDGPNCPYSPDWLVAEIHRQWERNDPIPHEVFNELAANPQGIAQTFRSRWPPPIRATWILGAPFNNVPRVPIQVLAYAKLVSGYAIHRFPRQVRRYRRVDTTSLKIID